MHHDSSAQRPLRLAAATLEDKYTLPAGRAYMTGIQALVRLCINQRLRDQAAGLNTAGFVSGYRGSPLGPLDKEFWKAGPHLEQAHVRFDPAINEELGATAVMGSQQLHLFPGARYDGVFSIWYGKAPGVDRCADAFKHGNFAGTARHGGVLVMAGDDHGAYSSSLPNQSDHLFMHCYIPLVHPASVQEFLDLGIHGWAMSRYSGCYVGFKTLADTVESSAIADVDPMRVLVHLPQDFELPPEGLNVRLRDTRFEQEARIVEYRMDAVRAYVRANGLNRVTMDSAFPRIGVVAVGKSYLDVLKALEDLGIDAAFAAQIGLRVLKVCVPWPLERESMLRFARGLEQIIVVEEKRALVESQLKELLYPLPENARPRIVGKDIAPSEPDFDRRLLLSEKLDFSPADIALLLAARLRPLHDNERMRRRVAQIEERLTAARREAIDLQRLPWYCSGCPHNSSTKVPEGSYALSGIGCHWMANWIAPDATRTSVQMGGEGVTWMGIAPFTDHPHVFSNLGDGTYFHSGLLAIRQAVAGKLNITYKILYNDAVAMTGGQPVDGPLSVPMLVEQLRAEGVERIVLVTDRPELYNADGMLDTGIPVYGRERLDHVQRELRSHRGVSVLIYEQTCATEKMRRRKRSKQAVPNRRLVINQEVCEGCGDCGEVSNCTALVPVETDLGRKRAIDQTRCSEDMSCLGGFCPSFVSVEGGRRRKGRVRDLEAEAHARFELPEPQPPSLDHPYAVLCTGIGGTGILTSSGVLGVAAQIDGVGALVLDMTGMAQKNGGVTSHLHFAANQARLSAARVAVADADLVLALDLVVACGEDALSRLAPGRTRFVGNTATIMPGQFVQHPDLTYPLERMTASVERQLGRDRVHWLDANALSNKLFGNALPANLLVIGYAWQKGLLPLTRAAIERAIELNGTGVEQNLSAFTWGRRAAADPAAVERLVNPSQPIQLMKRRGSLTDLVADRVGRLTAYQSAAYAQRYAALVQRVRAAERLLAPGAEQLAQAVARSYHKLLAYKDEYEVARLYADSDFLKRVEAQFEGDYKLSFHLAAPLLARRDPDTGLPRKRRFGPWMLAAFRVLARLKGLRGTPFDPFGYRADRKLERRLIRDYEALIEELLAGLKPANHALAVQLAALPERIRGFGHVKAKHAAEAAATQAQLLQAFRSATEPPLASAA
jgi:indolepyruvate ferredoxin oxidoreductase